MTIEGQEAAAQHAIALLVLIAVTLFAGVVELGRRSSSSAPGRTEAGALVSHVGTHSSSQASGLSAGLGSQRTLQMRDLLNGSKGPR